MVKANELRLGNWLERSDSDQPYYFQVSAVASTEISGNPIQLTEKWLVEFGLKTNPNNKYEFTDNEYFTIELDGSLYFEGSYTAVDINYVHQLQNLYFALTGQELTRKESHDGK